MNWKEMTRVVQDASVTIMASVDVTYTPKDQAALPAFGAMFRDGHEDLALVDGDLSVMGIQLVLEFQRTAIGQDPTPDLGQVKGDRIALEDPEDLPRFAGKLFRVAHSEQDGEGMLACFLNEVSV